VVVGKLDETFLRSQKAFVKGKGEAFGGYSSWRNWYRRAGSGKQLKSSSVVPDIFWRAGFNRVVDEGCVRARVW
jgi:hypothetical protein